MTRMLRSGALACALIAAALTPALFPVAAHAAEVVTKGDTAVILPFGDYIVAALQAIEPAVVTILTTLIGIFVTRLFPLARMFLTDRVVEAALTKWLDYGLNAVAGAAKGKALNVETGSTVLATAVNRALDRANVSKVGKQLLDRAGGPAEVANKLFRMLHLDDTGSDKILQEVLADLRAAGHLKA